MKKITLFQKQKLPDFWFYLTDRDEILSAKSKLVLLPFSAARLCGDLFSAYTDTKTKYRSLLNAEPTLACNFQ